MPSLTRRLSNPGRSTIRALLASAMVKTGPDVSGEKTPGEGGFSRTWQREGFDYYDQVGELHYAGTFVGSCLSRVRLTIGVPDEEGNPGPAFDDEGQPLHPDAPEALAYLRDLRAQIGGQSALMRAFGLNLFIAGEGYLTGTDKGGTRSWEVLSVEEIRPAMEPIRSRDPLTGEESQRPGYERKVEPNAPAKPLPAESYVVRVWRSHPRYAWLADAPTKAVRDILDELVLLTRQVRSQALSRLWMNGVWIVPNEIDYPDDDNASDESPEGDPLTRDLIKVVSTAIADPASAAGQVPFVFRVPYDLCDAEHLRYMKIDRTSDDNSVEKRAEAVLRLARGLDLPVEVVLGHAQTTFSNAWQIDESLFKSHIEPLVETVVDCLTLGYLRVVMPATELVIHYDPNELVAHPDRTKDAAAGHAAFVLSNSTYRKAIGFTDADAPDAAEMAERIEIAQAVKAPSFPAMGGPDGSLPGVGPVTTGDAGLAAAAEVSVLRALQRVGARIRSKANGNQAVREIIRGTPDEEVASVLGPAMVASIVGDEDLFRSEFIALRRVAARTVGAGPAEELARDAEETARTRLYKAGAR